MDPIAIGDEDQGTGNPRFDKGLLEIGGPLHG
jgi:hypothetical protein